MIISKKHKLTITKTSKSINLTIEHENTKCSKHRVLQNFIMKTQNKTKQGYGAKKIKN
jgi:hypothetical protein